jgi:tRNA (cytidine32/uridine32-2'-O)-methyltransferase
MRLADFVIVLVRPSRPANVAAACRAMKNMGIGALRIVEPPADLNASENRALAYGAWDVLDAAVQPATLLSAVADATLVVGTSAKAGSTAWTPRELAREAAKRGAGGRVAVVFGPEASGLTNEELALCHATVRIPTDGRQPSLNLAQAVLIVAYELLLAVPALAGLPEPPPAALAKVGDLERALLELRSALTDLGYLNRQNPGAILAELRALLVRAAPSPREVALLRGLARQLTWASSRIAGGAGPEA